MMRRRCRSVQWRIQIFGWGGDLICYLVSHVNFCVVGRPRSISKLEGGHDWFTPIGSATGSVEWRSFIYILRLFKWNYSEALPTLALPNNVVLSCWRNFIENTLGSDRRANGRPFHTKGPTTEKARLCMVEVRANGTWRRPCSAERRWRVLRAVRRSPKTTVSTGGQCLCNPECGKFRRYCHLSTESESQSGTCMAYSLDLLNMSLLFSLCCEHYIYMFS